MVLSLSRRLMVNVLQVVGNRVDPTRAAAWNRRRPRMQIVAKGVPEGIDPKILRPPGDAGLGQPVAGDALRR
jgi:hypothetical protein